MGDGSLWCQTESLTLLRELDERGKRGDSAAAAAGAAGWTRVHVSEGLSVKGNNSRTRHCHKSRTVAERARESIFSRLVEILSQIISIEQELMGSLSADPRKFLRRKDNIDLKNICWRMSLRETGYQSDKDLRELRVCLQLIVTGLLSAVRSENTLSSTGATGKLMAISVTFPDV